MLGYDAIPERWKSGLPAIAERKFSYTDYSFNEIVASTIARATKVIETAGGRVTPTQIAVPAQAPKPPKLEAWTMGVPDRRVDIKDAAWQWKGTWAPAAKTGPQKPEALAAATAGNEATFTFTGSAVTILGVLSQTGGRADVFLDAKRSGEIDAYIPPDTNDNALWHTYGLADGTHTVRIVTRADKAQTSRGTTVALTGAVTYRAARRGTL